MLETAVLNLLGDSHSRYLASVLQQPFDIRLHYDWDRAGGHLQVHEITLKGPGIGLASLSMDLDVPANSGTSGFPRNVDLSIRRIHLALDNRSVIEKMLMPLLVGLIPRDKDPAVEFPRIQEEVERQVGKLPDMLADRASKDALVRFARDFPHPAGHFEETISFDPPLRLDALRTDKEGRWVRGAHVQALYQSAPSVAAP